MMLAVAVVAPSFAQMTDDPTAWKYEVKKKSGNEYQLVFHVQLQDHWHIWSMQPGGDGMLIAPSFTFNTNKAVKMNGKMTETGKKTTTTMEGIDGKVNYLSGTVDFTQNVTVNGHTKITGKHTYQVCNDQMCLAPKDKEFVFEIK